MIDWPRTATMRHLTEMSNLALVTRRQMCPGQPCNFFFVADEVVIDGLIRSDNRGTESFFPLFLAGDATNGINLDERFLAALRERVCGGGEKQVLAIDVFHYIYATFHDPHYRARFAAPLTLDYPRVFLPEEAKVFRRMAGFGARLVDSQLLRFDSPASEWSRPVRLGRGYPKWHDGRLWLNADCGFELADGVWQYRVGSYQVLKKWLKERRHEELCLQQLQLLKKIAVAIERVLSVELEIERFVQEAGGWEECFAVGSPDRQARQDGRGCRASSTSG